MKSPEGMVFIFSLGMMVFSFYMLFMKENTDFSSSQLAIDDLKGLVATEKQVQVKIIEDQKQFASQTVQGMAELTEQLKRINGDREKGIKVTFAEPLRVSMVYRKRDMPAEAPRPTPPSLPKAPGPLLKRAGIKPLLGN